MNAPDVTSPYRESNRATGRLAIWTLAWVATLAVARLGPELVWDPARQPVVSWVAVAVNLLVGVAWIVAYTRYLRAVDELQRKINLDALAVTLGAGWVVGFAYFVANAAGLISFEVNAGLFPALLGVVYLSVVFAGMVRYR